MRIFSLGFNLIESLIVIAIVLIITTFAFNPFTNFRNQEALTGAVEEVLSTLATARNQTLASVGDSQYGVHLSASQVVLFTGATYNSADTTNKITTLNSLIEIANISLVGGDVDIVFQRLTGTTGQSGSLVLRLKAAPSQSRTINLNVNGISDVN